MNKFPPRTDLLSFVVFCAFLGLSVAANENWCDDSDESDANMTFPAVHLFKAVKQIDKNSAALGVAPKTSLVAISAEFSFARPQQFWNKAEDQAHFKVCIHQCCMRDYFQSGEWRLSPFWNLINRKWIFPQPRKFSQTAFRVKAIAVVMSQSYVQNKFSSLASN